MADDTFWGGAVLRGVEEEEESTAAASAISPDALAFFWCALSVEGLVSLRLRSDAATAGLGAATGGDAGRCADSGAGVCCGSSLTPAGSHRCTQDGYTFVAS